MKATKRCEYILEDGHKCNAVYSSRNNSRKYCNNHVGKYQVHDEHHGLVRSTNKYAKTSNAQTMQEWVKHKMQMEKIDKKKIDDLETKVARLESQMAKMGHSHTKIVDSISSNKKVVKSVLKEEMKTQHFRAVIDSLIVKRLHKSARHIPKPDDKRGDEDA